MRGLVIEESVQISAKYTLATKGLGCERRRVERPNRLIYAEFVELDATLIAEAPTGRETKVHD
jgi:hypothetical protein